jgi:hypothetical protein
MLPPGYRALEDGTIIGKRGKPLKLTPNTVGYLKFGAQDGTGKRVTLQVHVVVCEAFHGPRPSPRHQARHLDGNRLNCRADNLAWGTPAENTADKVRHGVIKTALTEAQVLKIRETYAAGGVLQRQLAVEYKVSRTLISLIVARKKWTHI